MMRNIMNRLADRIRRHQIIAFFIIPFVITWGLGFSYPAVYKGKFLLAPLAFLATCGPALAGIIISTICNTQPREGTKRTYWIAFLVAWAAQDVDASVKPLTPDEWAGLLGKAGLKEITAKTYAVDIEDEEKGILRRYGWGGILRIIGRTLRLYTKSPPYRDFVKMVRQGEIVTDHLNEYFGYGLFVGWKE